jgi:uncharacterized DUF497 family protein
MSLTFEWDEQKAEQNLRKHQVGFEEAKTIFGDPYAITIPDPHHSASESRYIDIGFSSRRRLLVVVYTERGPNIRIISCRRATRRERRVYEEYDF